MGYADPERQKKYLREHYKRNKAQYYGRTRSSLGKKKALLREAKNHPCSDCGKLYPFYVMDLDHRDSSTKRFNLARGGSNLRVCKRLLTR